MTALRQSAIMELEKIPEDKLSFVIHGEKAWIYWKNKKNA